MERLVEQPESEKLRSFDPLASVDMFRFDLERFNQILPETRRRVCNEELSYLAEGIDRQARTTFALRREDGQLKYFDSGEWCPYRAMLWSGLRVADKEAAEDSRLDFLAERAFADLLHGNQMEALKPGEQYAWYSPYPKRQERLHGKKFLQNRGFQPAREMGFLYLATGQEDGSVLLESQTVDKSDEEAFEAAMIVADSAGANLDDMTLAYDSVLELKHGGDFYAGRHDEQLRENVWETIQSQHDLVNYLLDVLETIASYDLSRQQLERAAKEHVYGVWAAFKKRIDNNSRRVPQPATGNPYIYHEVAQEVRFAFQDFARQGKVLIGCGGLIEVLKGEENLMDASPEDVFSSIFGTKSGEDKYGPLSFKCPRGHWNKRKPAQSPKDFLPHCRTCHASLKC